MSPRSDKWKILIVDDEPDLRNLLAWFFAQSNCDTYEAGHGEEALRLIYLVKPDAVLSDVRMPGTDGIQLLADAMVLDPSLPFFLISGYSDTTKENAVSLGACQLFPKPFSFETIVKQVLQKLASNRDASNKAQST